jgi:hypothetical protein
MHGIRTVRTRPRAIKLEGESRLIRVSEYVPQLAVLETEPRYQARP